MNKILKPISGAVPIIPIPFQSDEKVNESALQTLIDFAVDCKFSAICLPAYASEFYKLSDKERLRVVEIAANRASGRIQVIAQCNHGSSYIAKSLALSNLEAGADLISIAIPRQFPLSDDDLLSYLVPVLNGIETAVLLQDFNPGGPTLGMSFLSRLLTECPNLSFLKLEEPLSAPKVASMIEVTDGKVEILTGWGGMYLLELIPAGICGLMPGLGLADLLNKIFWLSKQGDVEQAFYFFEKIAPLLIYSLQNLEFHIYCEKYLLCARGLLSDPLCRPAKYQPDVYSRKHIEFLVQRVLKTLKEANLK